MDMNEILPKMMQKNKYIIILLDNTYLLYYNNKSFIHYMNFYYNIISLYEREYCFTYINNCEYLLYFITYFKIIIVIVI